MPILYSIVKVSRCQSVVLFWPLSMFWCCWLSWRRPQPPGTLPGGPGWWPGAQSWTRCYTAVWQARTFLIQNIYRQPETRIVNNIGIKKNTAMFIKRASFPLIILVYCPSIGLLRVVKCYIKLVHSFWAWVLWKKESLFGDSSSF